MANASVVPTKACAAEDCQVVFERLPEQSDASWAQVQYCSPMCRVGQRKLPPDPQMLAMARAVMSAVPPPPEWTRRATCCTEPGVKPDLFYPAGRGPAYAAQVTAAKEVCARCPVRKFCLTEAMRSGTDGVWGGTTPDERELARRNARRRAR